MVGQRRQDLGMVYPDNPNHSVVLLGLHVLEPARIKEEDWADAGFGDAEWQATFVSVALGSAELYLVTFNTTSSCYSQGFPLSGSKKLSRSVITISRRRRRV